MNRVVLIYNWQTHANEPLVVYLKQRGYEVKVIDNSDDGAKRNKIVNNFECLIMAIKALLWIHGKGVIISMCATPGIILGLISRNKKVKILALNLLSDFDKKINIRDVVYKIALNNPSLLSTCNAEEDITRYYQKYQIRGKNKIFVLNDGIAINSNAKLDVASNHTPLRIFSAGGGLRDWKMLSEVASVLSDLQFNVVASEKNWKTEYDRENIQVSFDIPHEEYMRKLQESDIVVIPLKNNSTAGLLVYFDAINSGKLPLITYTDTTKVFVPEPLHSVLLFGIKDVDGCVKKIREVQRLKQENMASLYEKVKNHLYANFSESAYCRKIGNMLLKI